MSTLMRINLLDWREARREERRRKFLTGLWLTIAASLAAVALVSLGYYGSRIDTQEDRNAYLEQQIQTARTRLVKLKEIKAQRASLVRRLHIVENLQQSRSYIVHYLKQISATLPEGVYLTSLQQAGDTTTLTGVAESNARISAYMINLDTSLWLDDPRLIVIKTDTDNRHEAAFTLQVDNAHQTREPDGTGD